MDAKSIKALPNRNTSEYSPGDDEIKKLPGQAVFMQSINKLALLEQQKKSISDEIREVSKTIVENGGTKTAFGIIRRIQKMDPDEREAVMHEIDAYATFLRFW